MSFLSQLKKQASALQGRQLGAQHNGVASNGACESACRLAQEQIQHERSEQRQSKTNKLQAYVFDYPTEACAFVTLTPEHDEGEVDFRLTSMGGFGVLATSYAAAQVTSALMDELAKKLVGQPSRFA